MSNTYGLQDLPGGDTSELPVHLIAQRSLILVIDNAAGAISRIVLWDDDGELRLAWLDIDARPLTRKEPAR